MDFSCISHVDLESRTAEIFISSDLTIEVSFYYDNEIEKFLISDEFEPPLFDKSIIYRDAFDFKGHVEQLINDYFEKNDYEKDLLTDDEDNEEDIDLFSIVKHSFGKAVWVKVMPGEFSDAIYVGEEDLCKKLVQSINSFSHLLQEMSFSNDILTDYLKYFANIYSDILEKSNQNILNDDFIDIYQKVLLKKNLYSNLFDILTNQIKSEISDGKQFEWIGIKEASVKTLDRVRLYRDHPEIVAEYSRFDSRKNLVRKKGYFQCTLQDLKTALDDFSADFD
jgi:hypothetical protein